ncbi:MAG: protein kinase domain-containing protein [Phycisphaerales bacterium]
MHADRFQRAQEIFLEIIEIGRDAREAVLLERCAGDEALLAEVRSLLEFHHDEDQGFLDPEEVRKIAREESGADEPTLPPGTRVGVYTVSRVLGQGGMGVVYLAQQERPRRTVALKLLRASVAGSSALRRFEHEAEVLGMLQHPGIAQIFEAGAADIGRGLQPYIAMEFIDGPSLASYARKKELGIDDRLRLMTQVCDGVHHAHQRGVIHRDLKPGNILVDPSGRPKVLDFGVSRAVDPDRRATFHSMHTSAGQLIGTLAYMSPEQASGDAEAIDVRSDVYALGVMLYELLSGQLPFDVRTKPLVEAARIIHDSEPRRLASHGRQFRGDLDVIVARALEKDKSRRYQSADDLADDLRRHLEGSPISAKQDSAFYVLKKQVRRHKLASALIGAIVISVTTLGIFSTFQAIRADREARNAKAENLRAQAALAQANLERARADANASRADHDLAVSNIERGRLLSAGGSLVLAEEQLWPELLRDPTSPHAFWAVWELYSRIPCRDTLPAHEPSVRALAYSNDGSIMVSAGERGDVTAWDARTMTELARVALGLPTLRATMCFTPDDRLLIVADITGQIHVWNTAGWTIAACPEPVPTAPLSADLSPDGSLYAVVGDAGAITVYNTEDWSVAWRCLASRALLGGVAFSPDSAALATTGTDEMLRFWDARTGALQESLFAHQQAAHGLDWSPDGKWLVTGGTDRMVKVWDATLRAVVRQWDAANGTITRVHFSPDSTKVAIGGWWRTDLLDWETWTLEASYAGHRRGLHALAWAPDSTSFATGSVEPYVRVWDLPSRVIPASVPGHNHRSTAVFINEKHGRVIASGYDRSLFLREYPSLKPIKKLAGGGAYGTNCTFIGDGSRFAYLVESGPVYICDSRDGAPLCTINQTRLSTAMASSPDGSTLYVAEVRGAISSWNTHTGELIEYWGTEGWDPLYMRIHSGGTRLELTQRDRVWQSWSLPGFAPSPTIATDAPTWALDVSSDGTLAALTTWGSEVQLWNPATRNYLGTLEGHRQLISGCVLSPRARYVLTASTDGTVRWWDAVDQRGLLSLQTPDQQPMNTVAIASDGRTVISGGFDGRLYKWDLTRFDRHIAGNLESQLSRWLGPSASGAERENARKLRAWAASVRQADQATPRAAGGLCDPP